MTLPRVASHSRVAYDWALRSAPLIAGLGYVVLLLLTASSIGYARDESFYFAAADRYVDWLKVSFGNWHAAAEHTVISRHFSLNAEHPPLAKWLFGLSHQVLSESHALRSRPGISYRLPTIVLSGLCVATLVHWGSQRISRPAGLVAGLGFAFLPRVFHHAHLACFDMPVASLCLCSAYLWQRALESKQLRWSLAFGVVYGFALATKHNAWLLPPALLLHGLLTQGGEFLASSWRARLALLLPALSMLVLSPLVLIAVWPWLWFDTKEHLLAWVRFHSSHIHFNMEFLGFTYWRPPMPRAYAWVMTLATVPLTTLALFLTGLLLGARKAIVLCYERARSRSIAASSARACSDWLLWSLCAMSFYSPWLSTNTPIFGGTKHWLTAYPFLCLLAAQGFAALCSRLPQALPSRWRSPASQRWATVVAVLCVLAPGIAIIEGMGPWGLSTYTPIVGGASGAATLGLNRTFWGYTSLAVAPELAANAPARVFIHDMTRQAWDMHTREGAWPGSLTSSTSVAESDLALYHHEPHMAGIEYRIWAAYGTATPIAVGTYEGVPIVWLFKRPRP
jgi:4-amino-4-deoxy-L-arabinose transferase-like glycosyltransferase